MRRPLAILALVLLGGCLWAAAPAGAAFGLKDLDVTFTDANGNPLIQAGRHPLTFTTELAVNTKVPDPPLAEIDEVPDGETRNLTIEQIPGLAGNPGAVPTCFSADFLKGEAACSRASRVGTAHITAGGPDEVLPPIAVYNLDPPPGGLLKVGFVVLGVPVTVEATLKPTPPYNPVVKTTNITNLVSFYAAEVDIWGVPADHAHDAERGGEAGIPAVPFLTVPRACEGPLPSTFEALSWQGDPFAQTILTHDDSQPPQPFGFTGCEKLGFAPRAAAELSTAQASSPTGFDFTTSFADENLANPDGIADSDLKKATVTLPEGMTINPSIAEGLAVCSAGQYSQEALEAGPGEGCPQASKVGTVEAETPLLAGTLLKGSLFVAQQGQNPFGSLIALYMVVSEPEKGIFVKLAGRVTPDPLTGQLVTTFGEPGEELPQEPLSRVRVRLREGARSPLISPPGCDADPSTPARDPYTATAAFTPWANPQSPLDVPSSFSIAEGVGGGPCPPAGPPPFAPGFAAGTLNNDAKSFSPFFMRLTRRDGDQDMTKFSAILPPGISGIVAGLGRCTEAQIAAARAKSGREEAASPSCPASTEIGHTLAGAGVGSQLTYVPGALYLAGPYKGDPLSVVAITPAVAGPFDVGTVVVRVALTLNPRTLQIEADGSASDPIPHILAGIVLKVRDLRVFADRPNFIFNPTDCDPLATQATLFGSAADVFNPADDAPVSLSDRFRAANCARLPFKPRFSFRLKGGTARGDHPALRSVVRPRSGDANFRKAVVTLPRSAFLDQAHIRTICTRVQFAAGAGNGAQCPPGSIYGHATAYTPLIEEPATGPVYLRSSNHNLPDLVVALKGPPSAAVDAELVGRIDSHKGGIRASFEQIPDLPVSKFVLEMQGGRKGLIVNSRGLCDSTARATLRLTGQNERRLNSRAKVSAAGCGGKAKGSRAKRRLRR